MTNVSSAAIRVYQKQQRAKKRLSLFTKLVYSK
jgi:hypothetical protein